jgi:hypothetical protein
VGIVDVFLRPFLGLRDKVKVLDIETEVADYYVVVYIKCENEEQAHRLAEAIDQVKDKLLALIR